jgi:hypothetical protein
MLLRREKATKTPSVAKTTPDKPEVMPLGTSITHKKLETTAAKKILIRRKIIMTRLSLVDELRLDIESNKKSAKSATKLFERCHSPSP